MSEMANDQVTYVNGSSFFRNTACEYFPCHEGLDESEFNCLFCYCPLYALGPHCGGNFTYTEKGIKDCTACTILHKGNEGARIVKERFGLLAAKTQCSEPQASEEPLNVSASKEG